MFFLPYCYCYYIYSIALPLFISLHIYIFFKTASGTRSFIKKHNKRLLSPTLLDQTRTRIRTNTHTNSISATTPSFVSMMDSTVLAKARKARFDDLPSFSGHPSEDVERFLKSIKNITKATDESDNHEILEVVRGKLTKSAGIWFDNNESKFKTWLDFETAFRTRYFSTTILHTKFEKLKRRKQQPDESITVYFDEIVDLCREIDSGMSDSMIIQHLMSGLNSDFKKELSRRRSTISTLADFLKYAKIEQDLYDTFDKSRKLSLESQQSSTETTPSTDPPVTTAVEPKRQRSRYNNATFEQSSYNTRNSNPYVKRNFTGPPGRQNQQPRIPSKNTTPHPTTTRTPNRTSNCKVCGRPNHRTIDCFHKRQNGCFNCGRNHAVRDCTMPPHFQ